LALRRTAITRATLRRATSIGAALGGTSISTIALRRATMATVALRGSAVAATRGATLFALRRTAVTTIATF
ncbi:hypothetical protein AB0J47_31960, partial [Nocardia sp. NPDC049737]|uniref:hypothetical protein n=1 Tax=Nocardia sp. NPDC049737 TaxID=3154358 RepID=UPI003414619F